MSSDLQSFTVHEACLILAISTTEMAKEVLNNHETNARTKEYTKISAHLRVFFVNTCTKCTHCLAYFHALHSSLPMLYCKIESEEK